MKRIFLAIAVSALLLLLPFLVWLIQGKEPLSIAIIDKTVPTENYREHHGLTWLLNYHRYTKPNGEKYEEASDFYGFMPDEKNETYTINEVPESLDGTDLIYIADTYGVYQEDLSWGGQPSGAPSLLYGGMDAKEWETVKQQVTENGTGLVVEFNSFSSPTDAAVREDVTEFLGVNWTGWSGRYFGDLTKSRGEVPPWIVSRFEKHGGTWDYAGAGFVLVSDSEKKIVVLSEERGETGTNGIQLKFTEAGTKKFPLGDSPSFNYWFDISEAHSEGDIIADYDWDLTATGSAILEEHGIPENFPAIVHQKKAGADVYFFGGDFVDVSDMPDLHQYAGFAKVLSGMSFINPDADTSFYWRTYAPLMERILADAKSAGSANTPKTVQANESGINYPSRINGQKFEVFEDGKWQPFIVKGVNMGMAKPGTFPGEAAITQEEYGRWFKQIGEMNANAIRVYTLHPPAFYDALKSYNDTAKEPLYVYHGVWIEEQPLVETLDAFDKDITQNFQTEIKRLVDVIHGNAEVEPKPGHAAGIYNSDISPYVIGWVIGIEWSPIMVAEMDGLYPELGDYDGTHLFTKGANPMEHWLARQLDVLAEYELSTYQSMRPLSFTNCVTTDNLKHPAEPNEEEDMAAIDPNHLKLKGQLQEAGMFASYHVYPYYPDFLNLEEKHTEFIDHRGERNSYAGYLKDLNDSHELPILIAEFGMPASRGKTHDNPFGWNQGFISEQQQGEIVQHLYEDILNEELLGGLVFSWQDEWFKRTWNTMDYDNPDRRPFWSNAQTNEQQFGLLSFDRHKVKVNGEDDWKSGEDLYTGGQKSMASISMDHDERYLYIKTEFNESARKWWDKEDFHLYLSVRDKNGIDVEIAPGTLFKADFDVSIKGKDGARLLVAGDYDSFYFDYAEQLKLMEPSSKNFASEFHPIKLALSKGMTRPDTGEVIPFSSYETGMLQFGIADPAHAEYNSLNDWYYSEETGILEIRIPWMLLNAKDPSQLEFMGDMRQDGVESSVTIKGIEAAGVLVDEKGELADSFTASKPAVYRWTPWELPEPQERLKQSYYILQELFGEVEMK